MARISGGRGAVRNGGLAFPDVDSAAALHRYDCLGSIQQGRHTIRRQEAYVFDLQRAQPSVVRCFPVVASPADVCWSHNPAFLYVTRAIADQSASRWGSHWEYSDERPAADAMSACRRVSDFNRPSFRYLPSNDRVDNNVAWEVMLARQVLLPHRLERMHIHEMKSPRMAGVANEFYSAISSSLFSGSDRDHASFGPTKRDHELDHD